MQILSTGRLFRVLIHPEEKTQNLPKGVDLDAAISSFTDERGLKAILKDVEVAYYISSADQTSSELDLQQAEVREVETFMHSAEQAGVERIIYLSHLGADRASGFNLLKAKGIAEHIIKESSLKYTILRSSITYGEGDVFSKNLAKLIRYFLYYVPIPGNPSVLLQPIWVKDLVTCFVWCLDLPETENSIIEIGGPEHLSLLEILQQIAEAQHKKRQFFSPSARQLNSLLQLVKNVHKDFPRSNLWMDYFTENQICALDSLPRIFGINPARFHQKIDYLNPHKTRK